MTKIMAFLNVPYKTKEYRNSAPNFLGMTVQKCPHLPKTQNLGVRVQVDAVSICDPLLSPVDADMALRSLEGTVYRVCSDTLRSNSGFFSAMMSLPKNEIHIGHRPVIAPRSETILDVHEDDFPLKTLLCLMSDGPIPAWETINPLECVLQLAEKWDTPGPINILRSALTARRFIESYPLRCYRLATHFNWETEAKLASHRSLILDIFDPIHRDILNQLSSKDLLSLFNLHRKRQIMFRELLHCPERFVAGNCPPYYCQRCGTTEPDNSAWKNLKIRMFLEMERRPMGDTLNAGADCWPEARVCWEARCSKKGCGALHYDKSTTLRQIEACIALLPKTIERED